MRFLDRLFRKETIPLWEAAEIALYRTKETERGEVIWLNSGYDLIDAKVGYCHLLTIPRLYLPGGLPMVVLTGVFDDGSAYNRKRLTIDPWTIGNDLIFEVHENDLILRNRRFFSESYSQCYTDLKIEKWALITAISSILGEK